MSSAGRVFIPATVTLLLLVTIDILLGSAPARVHDLYAVGVRIGVYGVAALSAATAASTFGWWRESIGRPWTLFALEYALLVVNYVLRRTAPGASLALDATLIGANVAQIAAYYLVARMLDTAGLGYLMSPRRRTVLTLIALAAAIVITSPSLAAQWRAFAGGTFSATSLLSLLSDVLTFTLIAPLLMSTIALHGGQVYWTFLLLTLSVFGWMFNSVGAPLAVILGGGDGAVRSARLAGVVMASLFNAAAATTQWAAARRTMRGSVANA